MSRTTGGGEPSGGALQGDSAAGDLSERFFFAGKSQVGTGLATSRFMQDFRVFSGSPDFRIGRCQVPPMHAAPILDRWARWFFSSAYCPQADTRICTFLGFRGGPHLATNSMRRTRGE